MKTGDIMRKKLRNDKGFTLIEVIAVLIILAVVSAVVISRGMDTDSVKLQAEVDTLKGHLRYAQYLAMNDISPNQWGISINLLSGSSYTLVKFDGTSTAPSSFNLPNESSATHSFSPFTTTAATVLFNEWGSPTITGSPSIGGQSISITATTGFMQ